MSGAGLPQGARLVCITLALGVHAAAAAAFILAPAADPPPPPAPGVEIEMLAEITSESAAEVTPAVAAQSAVPEAAEEAQPGEARSAIGEEVNARAPPTTEKTDVTPEEAPEAKPTEVTAIDAPVALEKPVIEAPASPALIEKPKPAAKKVRTVKTPQRRAAVAGATLTREATRKGSSTAQRSGGSQASANYQSVVQGRVASRRPAMASKVRSDRSRLVHIRFAIAPNGSVRAASVAKSSGDAALDSDVRAIVAAIDFPPPPPGAKVYWTIPIKLGRN